MFGFPSHRRNSTTSPWRRGVVLALLAALGVGTVGFPASPRVLKDRGIPFPCQDSPCGCPDAESCWLNCRCHSDAEKLAWARQHRIVPPPEFLESLDLRVVQASPRCRHCASDSDFPHAEPSEVAEASLAATPSANLPMGTLIDAFRRCRGLPLLWTVLESSGCDLPEPLVLLLVLAGPPVVVDGETFFGERSAPPVPPPQRPTLS